MDAELAHGAAHFANEAMTGEVVWGTLSWLLG